MRSEVCPCIHKLRRHLQDVAMIQESRLSNSGAPGQHRCSRCPKREERPLTISDLSSSGPAFAAQHSGPCYRVAIETNISGKMFCSLLCLFATASACLLLLLLQSGLGEKQQLKSNVFYHLGCVLYLVPR